MEIIFKAVSDIPEGSLVKLNFETGELSITTQEEMELQQKEEPNIIEGKNGG